MPELHLLVGPNGAGKTTLWEQILAPFTRGLPFVNADLIARERWPGDEEARAYEAARIAEEERGRLLAARRSFAAETVFSHPSKLALLDDAKAAGYFVTLYVVMVPIDLAVERARLRGEQGGHTVPETKVRERYRRLWAHVAVALQRADEALLYDNADARRPLRLVARLVRGRVVGEATLPAWSPLSLPRRRQ